MFTLVPLEDEATWSAALHRCGGHDTYHLPSYQRLSAPKESTTVLVTYEGTGSAFAALPLTVRPVPVAAPDAGPALFDASSVYGYPGLLTSTAGTAPIASALAADFTAGLLDLLRSLDVVTVFIRQNPLFESSWMFAGPGVQVISRGLTIPVDLRPAQEDRWAAASGNHRRQLRKAQQLDLEVHSGRTPASVAAFVRCYNETMERRDATEDFFVDTPQVSRILDELGEHAELWTAAQEGTVVTAGIFLLTGPTIQYHLGGTATDALPLGAARLLFELVAESGHSRGYETLHLGGGVGAGEDSLFRFKAGFSPRRLPYETVSIVVDSAAYADLCARSSAADTDFFPRYRSAGLTL